ncbi:ribosomal RNA small subunit methyltransferase G [Fagus crenata]
MKKMKGVVAMDASLYAVSEDPRTRFRHQSLLQDFEELQKESEVMKKKLQMMKQKKLTLSAEVRFLRKRYKYLITNQSPKPQPKQDFVQPQKFDTRNTGATKGKKYSKKEAALRHLVLASDLNRNERVYNGVETTLRKPASIFDLNQKARTFNGKEAALPTSAPIFDLNQKERIYSGKDATKRNSTPVFDLNQISTEEEELQADCEPLRADESKKSLLRGGSDEQHNDMKLSICRNIGSGSNRAGKRKISWQDQVALRV